MISNRRRAIRPSSLSVIFPTFRPSLTSSDAVVMDAITQVNADYGDRLCVYAIQVGSVAGGKDLSEEIVQNVIGGYAVNADRLATPAAMASFVEKVITGDCSRYQQLFAKPKETAVIDAAEPKAEAKVVAAVPETKAEETVAAAVRSLKRRSLPSCWCRWLKRRSLSLCLRTYTSISTSRH